MSATSSTPASTIRALLIAFSRLISSPRTRGGAPVGPRIASPARQRVTTAWGPANGGERRRIRRRKEVRLDAYAVSRAAVTLSLALAALPAGAADARHPLVIELFQCPSGEFSSHLSRLSTVEKTA